MVLNSGSGWGILNREILRDILVVSSRPFGTFPLSNLYPGLRPGLSSAVPAGLISQSIRSHAGASKPVLPFPGPTPRFRTDPNRLGYDCREKVMMRALEGLSSW